MSTDALALAFRSLQLPTMAALWEESVQRAEGENWGYRRLLQHLCDSEEQDRRQRRVGRLLKASGLPDGKTLGNLEEAALPSKIRRQACSRPLKTVEAKQGLWVRVWVRVLVLTTKICSSLPNSDGLA
jgi:DNA replication protein DnaC